MPLKTRRRLGNRQDYLRICPLCHVWMKHENLKRHFQRLACIGRRGWSWEENYKLALKMEKRNADSTIRNESPGQT